MAIRDLFVDGFGHFHQYALRDLPSGLVVVHGPNEAGKTTLTRFLLFLLFGAARGERPEALAGGRPGGRVTLVGAHGAFTVERFLRDPPVVRDAHGVHTGEEALSRLLGAVDRAMYRAVWSFALEDLRSLEGLGKEDLRDRLFTGTLAGAGRSVSAALAQLDRRQQKLWRPKASSPVGDLERRLAELGKEVRAAQARAADLQRLVAAREQAEAERRERIARAVAREGEVERFRALLGAREAHRALRRAEAELAEAPEGVAVDPEVLAAARRLAAELTPREAGLAKLRAFLEARRNERNQLPPVSAWAAEAERVRALHRRLRELPTTDLSAQREQAEARLTAALREAGLPDRAALAALDLGQSAQEVLRERAAALIAHTARTDRLRALEVERARLAERAEGLARELADLPRNPVAVEAWPEVEALRRDERAVAEERVRLDDLRVRLERARAEADRLGERLGEGAERASDDLRAREQLAAGVRSWQEQRVAAVARANQARALVKQRQEALRRAEEALQAAQSAPAVPDGAEEVVAGSDAAFAAWSRWGDALVAARDARGEAEGARAGLGWPAEAVEGARLDEGSKEALRGAARAVLAAESTAASAEEARVAMIVEAERHGFDPATPGPMPADVEQREATLAAAEAAVRARDEAAARAAVAGAGVSSLVRWAGVALGALIALLGAWTALSGALAPGLLVAALGLVVAVGAFLWLPGGAAPVAASDDRASALLRELGLPGNAGSADLARLRAELAAERRRADLRDRHARAAAICARRRVEHDDALRQWREALRRAGWPEVTPAEFERALVELVRVREHLSRAEQNEARAAENERIWSAWVRGAEVVAVAAGREVPTDVTSARALVEALREVLRAGREVERRREAHEQAFRQATDEYAAAREELVAAEREVGEVEAAERALRERAGALGVPDGVGLDVAVDWLAGAEELARLRARIAEDERQAATLQRRILDHEARARAVLVERLGCAGPDPLAEAESRCRSARELETAWRDAEDAWRRAKERVDEKDVELDALRAEVEAGADAPARWREALSVGGLPETLAAPTLETFLDAARRARRFDDDLAALDREEDAAREAEAELVRDVAVLAEAIGEPVPRDLAAARELLERAVTQVTTDEGRAEALARADAQVREAEERVLAEERALDELRTRLVALLEPHGAVPADDPEAIRAALEALEEHRARWERRAALVARVAELRAGRDSALGELAGDPDAVASLDNPDENAWRAAVEEAQGDAAAERKRAEEALQRRTLCEVDVEKLKGSREIATLEAEIADATVALAEARRELAVLVLAAALLERTLQRFREEHQPAILRRAGQFVSTVTGGTYVGVESDLEGRTLILVDREGGRRVAEELSTGTVELLYLVLRLGLVRDLGQGSPLPLVLDDVLANLDPERAARVADLLAEVAAEQQVLLLTCRPETRELLAARDAHVVELPRYAGRALPVSGTGVAEGGATRDGLPEAAERILDALSGLSEAVGRQRLLELSGIPDTAWGSAIQQLKDAGLVVQEGERRGARYRLAHPMDGAT